MKPVYFVTALMTAPLSAAPEKRPAKSPPEPPAVQAAPVALDAAVKLRIEMFFKLLREDRPDGAYAKLFEGSVMAKEQPDKLAALANNTEALFGKCGKLESAAILTVRTAGTTLKEVVCIANCQKRPVRWLFYAYYSEGRWQIVDTDVDPELESFFEPVRPAAH